jgi:hypothetical protein
MAIIAIRAIVPIRPIISITPIGAIIAVATPVGITIVVLVISPPASFGWGRGQGESAHECCHQNRKGTCSHVVVYTHNNPEYSKMLRFVSTARFRRAVSYYKQSPVSRQVSVSNPR